MIRSLFKPLVSAISLTASLLAMTAQSAFAASLYNGWQYTIDPSYDSLDIGNGPGGIVAGGTVYEIYGMAIKVTDTEVWVAINGNLPLTGNPAPDPYIAPNGRVFPVPGGIVNWGDLFFDFSGTNSFANAQGNPNFFGVRFAGTNDSGAPNIGVFQGVTGESVAPINIGWSNLANNSINGVEPRQGRDAWSGELAWNHPYFGPVWTSIGSYEQPQTLVPNVIDTGTQVGGVTQRDVTALLTEGYDPSFFFQQGTQTIGFSFQKPAAFQGNFVATLMTECVNDIISSLGYAPPPPPAPPEPEVCPFLLGQNYPILPTSVQGETKIFQNTLSHLWYDPPGAMGFDFQMIGDGVFTDILNFPCGITPTDSFTVVVNGVELGSFGPDQNQTQVRFSDYAGLLGNSLVLGENNKLGVRNFTITDIFIEDENAETIFPISLGFDKETGRGWSMTAIPEPTTILGSILASGGLLAAARRRKQR